LNSRSNWTSFRGAGQQEERQKAEKKVQEKVQEGQQRIEEQVKKGQQQVKEKAQ
jgi:hypothetical protein